MKSTKSLKEQAQEFKSLLFGKKLSKADPIYIKALDFISTYLKDMGEIERQDMISLMCDTFSIPRSDILGVEDPGQPLLFDPFKAETELRALMPSGGFYALYDKYTERTEAPLAFHLGCSLIAVGATVGRRVWMDMGVYKLYCNLGVILIGPSGAVKKTVSADVATSLIQEMELVKVYSEKLTPEALIESMKDMPQGLVYAPELAVFFGKQRYMDGIVPLLTRLLDCPDVWATETISRKKTILTGVGISCLYCSTPDWMVTAASEDLFKGGFFARHLIIIQEASCRVVPLPEVADPTLREKLIYQLAHIHELTGEMVLSAECRKFHNEWYRMEKKRWTHPENDVMGAYYSRKQSVVLKVAFNLHLGTCHSLHLCIECLHRAIAIVDWFEQYLPAMLRKMFKTQVGTEQEFIIRAIANAGGRIDHSILLHRLQHRMCASQVKTLLASLQEGGTVKEVREGLSHYYVLRGES